MSVSAVIDEFVPAPAVRERHTILVRAPADVVFEAASTLDFQSLTLVRWIIRLRELFLGTRRQAPRKSQPFVQEALSMGWGILREIPGRLLIAGATCQPWHANVVFTPLPAASFVSYNEPNQVKIAWTLEVEALGPGLTRFATETRAVATDAESRARFLAYWRWARFGIVTIRVLLLPAIRKRAETAWQPAR